MGWTGLLTSLVATALTACSPSLPASVLEGSTVTVGWSQSLTSLNAATTDGATVGNREVASITHDAFARLDDAGVVLDEAFGKVEITDAAADSFTVRYDLASRAWSDGVPLDAADLLLAWAAGSGVTEGDFDALPSDLRRSADAVPDVDQSERRIDVTFTTPVRGWQTALDVAVPAHVVGQEALGIEDPMEAKQAVIDAITDGDAADLAAIAEVWNTGFDLDPTSDDLPAALTLATGPYRVTGIERSESGIDHVRLEVNREYGGEVPASFERVDVVADDPALEGFPDDLDLLQVSPTPDNFVAVRDLERLDHQTAFTDDGRLWTMVLRADRGFFRARDARRAFIRATSRSDMRSAGAGAWEEAFPTTQSLLFAPEADGYTISIEDAGFVDAFEDDSTKPIDDRTGAGIVYDTEVCVLYDNDDAFATGAFEALRAETAEVGWAVTDCGRRDIDKAITKQRRWQAVIITVPLPETPGEITEVWGGDQESALTGLASPARARLVDEISRTPDPYEARDLQVQVEAGLIRDAVALPLTLEPVVTISERDLELVQPDSGQSVTLLSGAAFWKPES